MSPKNLTLGHLMNIRWLIAHVTASGSPARAEYDFKVILDVCWPIQAVFVVGEPVCYLEILS